MGASMKRSLLVLTVVALFGVRAGGVQADPITTLFNTGVAGTGALLSEGSADAHYQLIVSADPSFPGPTVFVVLSTGHPIPGDWMANGPASQWIAPQANQDENAGGGNAQGAYRFRTTFDMTGFNPSTAAIAGQWAVDDDGLDILINGHSTGIVNMTGLHTLTPFTLPGGFFVPGVNTLDFALINTGFSPVNPVGLRVEIVSATAQPTAVPEPGGLALLCMGVLSLLGCGWLRRKRVVAGGRCQSQRAPVSVAWASMAPIPMRSTRVARGRRSSSGAG